MTNIIPVSALIDIDDEPRILDVALAQQLGFGRATSIRVLIERNLPELELYGGLHRGNANSGGQGGRPGRAYYLNEGQALVLCALSRTEKAAAVRKLLIDVFMAWRKGKLVDVKAHYRKQPQPQSRGIAADLISYDGKTALLELWLPLPKALDIIQTLHAV